MSNSKRNCTSCKIIDEAGERELIEDELLVEEGVWAEEDADEEEEAVTTSDESDRYSTESEPDWDSENVSLRHLSWWKDRFKADREERCGHPLAPELCTVITEDASKIDEGEDDEDVANLDATE